MVLTMFTLPYPFYPFLPWGDSGGLRDPFPSLPPLSLERGGERGKGLLFKFRDLFLCWFMFGSHSKSAIMNMLKMERG